MIKVKQVIEEQDKPHPIYGNVHMVNIQSVDEETGQVLTNAEIYQAFQQLDIIGVYVKLHRDKLFTADAKLWPGFGMITDIDDSSVWLGSYEVPKQDFLEWYELD